MTVARRTGTGTRMGIGGTRTGSDPGGSWSFYEGFLLSPEPPEVWGSPRAASGVLFYVIFLGSLSPGRGKDSKSRKDRDARKAEEEEENALKKEKVRRGWMGLGWEWHQGDPGGPWGVVPGDSRL